MGALVYVLLACFFAWAIGTNDHASFQAFVIFMLIGIFNQVVEIKKKR
jgi:hypothetical protein